MLKKISTLALSCAVIATSVPAFAAGETLLDATDLATFGFDTAGLKIIGLAVLGVLAAMMTYRKMVKSTNRS